MKPCPKLYLKPSRACDSNSAHRFVKTTKASRLISGNEVPGKRPKIRGSNVIDFKDTLLVGGSYSPYSSSLDDICALQYTGAPRVRQKASN